jgi:hypothetical protein
VNYAKLLEMNSFFTLHSFLEVGKTQDLPSKFWQTLRDALTCYLQGKTSHPINIKGRDRLRPIIQSSLSILSYFLQTLAFPTCIALLVRLHGG